MTEAELRPGQTAGQGAPRGAAWMTAVVCAAQFVLQLDFSIVNVALPTIQRTLHINATDLQWIVTGYAMTFGSLLLVGGRLSDRFARKGVLVAGLVLFAIASLACGLAQWSLMLILSRIVQGAAGALVSPSALSLLTNMNPEGPARNRALSIWQATTAAGATAGIIAGGLLTQYLGWRAIFLVNPPLIAVILPLVRRLPSVESPGRERIDVVGGVLVTCSLASLIFGLSHGEQQGYSSLATLVALVAAVVFAIGFIAVERRSPVPMLPLSMLKVHARRAAMTAMFLMGTVLAGYVYFVSLYLQRVHHFDPLETGTALIPSTVTVVLTSTLLTRRLLTRLSIKTMLLLALLSMAAGQFWLSHVASGSSYAGAVLPGLLLTSFGIGLGLPSASIAITSGVQGRDQGLAGALFTTSQQTGAAVGLATLATIAAARTTSAGGSLVSGYRLSFLVATGIAICALVSVALQLPGARRRSSPAK